ncbi:MAG: hypothetical protein ACPG4N_05825, partial [Gammaproteobacteria bacterium]
IRNGYINVLGLSDDKPTKALVNALRVHGECRLLAFSSLIPSVQGPAENDDALGVVDLKGAGEDLRSLLEPLMTAHGGVNLIGNQQLMSLARRAWDIPLAGPGS